MKKLLALLFVLASCTFAQADELLHRYENAEIYSTGANTRKLVIGGPISNTEPFEIDGALVPESYKWTDVDEIAPDVYRMRKGKYGYTIYKTIGCVRVHPVRKRWDVYYEVCSKNPVNLDYRQVNDKLLELYKDTPQVRYSMFIGDRGYKINNRLKNSYTGPATWSYTYNVSMDGLTRQGRKLYHEGKLIGRLPDPYATGADGTIYPVQENINGGELTLTFTSADTCAKPCDIDPTLTPPTNTADNVIYSATADTNYGSETYMGMQSGANDFNTLIKFDFTPLPTSSTITSATIAMYYYSYVPSNDPVGETLGLYRETKNDWTELGSTWNSRVHGSLLWDSPGGDYTATDVATAVAPAAFGWITWNVTAQAQYAQANTGEIIYILAKFFADPIDKRVFCYSKEYAVDTAKRPVMTIEYRLANTIRPWCRGNNNEKSLCIPNGFLLPN